MFKNLSQYFLSALWGTMLSISATVASEIDSIDIRVVLDEVGTAHIYENWTVDVDNEETEWFLLKRKMNNLDVIDFKVRDRDYNTYLTDDTPWDSDRERDEKARKSGINVLVDGFELCWGVGSSGRHRWTAQYKIPGFVKQFNDGSGFNHCFVNYDLSSTPKFVRTTIVRADSMPIFAENAHIWAFNYQGTCLFDNGKIVAQNHGTFDTPNSMIVMCIFPKDAFDTPNIVNDSIGTMKWTALEGCDYLDNLTDEDYANGKNVYPIQEDPWYIDLLFILAFFVGLGIFLVVGVLCVYYGLALFWNIISLRPLRIKLRRAKLLKGRESDYYHGIAVGGNLNRSFYIIDEFNYKIYPIDKDNLFAAYLVRLMRLNAIKIVPNKQNNNLLNLLKIDPSWDSKAISGYKEADAECMLKLYNVMLNAAGPNLVLEKGELNDYLKKHPKEAAELNKAANKKDNSNCTPHEFQELIGLEKFLKEFTSIEHNSTLDVELWDEYLVFATLFGIADEVMNNFKKTCPDYFNISHVGVQLINCDGFVTSDFNSFTGISNIGNKLASPVSSSNTNS